MKMPIIIINVVAVTASSVVLLGAATPPTDEALQKVTAATVLGPDFEWIESLPAALGAPASGVGINVSRFADTAKPAAKAAEATKKEAAKAATEGQGTKH